VTFSKDTQIPRILRLQLSEFRNYTALDITTDAQFISLSGDNGAGKTNLLEAISLFCAGRGLRRADMSEIARHSSPSGWAVSLEIQGNLGEAQLGTGTQNSDQPRKCRIDRSPVSSVSAFADHLRVIWLTPAQDGLFTGSAGDRRRFLDRLVLAVDPNHGSRVSALERALRSRNRLLEDTQFDAGWASSIEREIAEIGVCVAAARAETVARLRALIARQRDETSPFPHADIMLNGALEIKLAQEPASQVEDWFRDELSRTRGRDRAAGRTLTGPQMSDLTVMHGPKSAPAGQCSTGEQKALLIGLILAHSQLVHEMTGIIPIMLLDEVAAHLDPKRRAGLYELLRHLGGQVFMTGTDASLFETLGTDSLKLSVSAGSVKQDEVSS
jgi:DNA replication and repair protein RecF